MNAHEPPAALPDWIRSVAVDLAGHARRGRRVTDGASLALGGFLAHLEVLDYPAPYVEVVSRDTVRLTWADGRKTLRLEVGPRRRHAAVSCPEAARRLARSMAAGQVVEATRAAFDWYRPRPRRLARRDES